jgi:putative phosphoribosyl transferase
VAAALGEHGLGTLLFDLLTEEEAQDRKKVFDIPLLAERPLLASRWLGERLETRALSLGYFGASTGAAAALVAAARSERAIGAIVSRTGRPDLARTALSKVRAPTLLIVGGLIARSSSSTGRRSRSSAAPRSWPSSPAPPTSSRSPGRWRR